MSLYTLSAEQVGNDAAPEEKIVVLAHLAYDRYRTISEDISGELLAVTTPERLIQILVLLRRRLKVRLAFIPRPPTNDRQRANRQSSEGRVRMINQEIGTVCRMFDLSLEEVK